MAGASITWQGQALPLLYDAHPSPCIFNGFRGWYIEDKPTGMGPLSM